MTTFFMNYTQNRDLANYIKEYEDNNGLANINDAVRLKYYIEIMYNKQFTLPLIENFLK